LEAIERRDCLRGGVTEGGIFAGRVQERKGGGGVVRNGVRKGNEGDYRLDNLRACVQPETHIRKGA